MLKLKLQYSGHLMRRVDSLEKTLMLGGVGGRQGPPKAPREEQGEVRPPCSASPEESEWWRLSLLGLSRDSIARRRPHGTASCQLGGHPSEMDAPG